MLVVLVAITNTSIILRLKGLDLLLLLIASIEKLNQIWLSAIRH